MNIKPFQFYFHAFPKISENIRIIKFAFNSRSLSICNFLLVFYNHEMILRNEFSINFKNFIKIITHKFVVCNQRLILCSEALFPWLGT